MSVDIPLPVGFEWLQEKDAASEAGGDCRNGNGISEESLKSSSDITAACVLVHYCS